MIRRYRPNKILKEKILIHFKIPTTSRTILYTCIGWCQPIHGEFNQTLLSH